MKHPIHPLIVHFPIACWSLATFGDLVTFILQYQFERIIGLLMALGCGIGLLTMAAGFYELLTLRIHEKENDGIIATLDKHMYAAISAWSFYLFSLLLRWHQDHFIALDYPSLITSLLGFFCLGITGWYGGNLVYKYGVGTSVTEISD